MPTLAKRAIPCLHKLLDLPFFVPPDRLANSHWRSQSARSLLGLAGSFCIFDRFTGRAGELRSIVIILLLDEGADGDNVSATKIDSSARMPLW